MATIVWDGQLSRTWAVWDVVQDIFSFNPNADVHLLNEATYLFESIRFRQEHGLLSQYLTIFGSDGGRATMVAAEIWTQFAEWWYVWEHPRNQEEPNLPGIPDWLGEFINMLDQQQVWRHAVAAPARHLSVSPEFVWECFCQIIDTFPHRLPPAFVVTLNSYRNRNVHPGPFDYVLELALDANKAIKEVTYRPKRGLGGPFIQFI